MDEEGFVFTIDAVLMLIPIFILAATVAHVNLEVPNESPYYSAQDALNTLYYSDVNSSIVNNLSINTLTSKAAASNAINKLYVLKSFNCPYVLNYSVSGGPEQNITPVVTPSSGTISIAKRQQGNVTLILYMWR